MQRELLEQMYRATELDDLLKESDYTIRRRKECQQMVESLSKYVENLLANFQVSANPNFYMCSCGPTRRANFILPQTSAAISG